MKTIGIILIAVLLINASFKPAQEEKKAKVYDYVSITVNGYNKPTIYVTINTENFEKINVTKEQSRDWFDNAEVFKLLNKYEKEGYELFSTNGTGNEHTAFAFYLLRKEKK